MLTPGFGELQGRTACQGLNEAQHNAVKRIRSQTPLTFPFTHNAVSIHQHSNCCAGRIRQFEEKPRRRETEETTVRAALVDGESFDVQRLSGGGLVVILGVVRCSIILEEWLIHVHYLNKDNMKFCVKICGFVLVGKYLPHIEEMCIKI